MAIKNVISVIQLRNGPQSAWDKVAEKYNEIPASINELYDRYINMVSGVNNTDTNVTQLFEPRYKLDFLISISYELFFKNSDTVSSEKLQRC